MRPFSVIVLAAGGSRRLGTPKQLVEYEGEPLVVRSVRTAMESGATEVIVVLGSNYEMVLSCIDKAFSANESIRYVSNDQWEAGMGSSIRVGARVVSPESEVIVVTVCDQPLVASELLLSLVAGVSDEIPASASLYAGVPGVPCAFSRRLLPDLQNLTGDRGARDLIRDPSRSVTLVEFEGGALDIDTVEDLSKPLTVEAHKPHSK